MIDREYINKRAIHFRHTYGMSIEQYITLLEKQNGVCAGCNAPPKTGGRAGSNRALSVDHDHATGDIRGLLCQGCNAALGLAKNSPDLLRALAAYLEKPPEIYKQQLTHKRTRLGYNRYKEACSKGHVFTPENTYVYPKNGNRLCRTCRREVELKRIASGANKKAKQRAKQRVLQKNRTK